MAKLQLLDCSVANFYFLFFIDLTGGVDPGTTENDKMAQKFLSQLYHKNI